MVPSLGNTPCRGCKIQTKKMESEDAFDKFGADFLFDYDGDHVFKFQAAASTTKPLRK